ncbi:hypothetical protein AURDEDRAFT_130132, partial [Auricularia subglabra TFB-10046 SS5]
PGWWGKPDEKLTQAQKIAKEKILRKEDQMKRSYLHPLAGVRPRVPLSKVRPTDYLVPAPVDPDEKLEFVRVNSKVKVKSERADAIVDIVYIDVKRSELAARERTAANLATAEAKVKEMQADPERYKPIYTSTVIKDKSRNREPLAFYFACDPKAFDAKKAQLEKEGRTASDEEIDELVRNMPSSYHGIHRAQDIVALYTPLVKDPAKSSRHRARGLGEGDVGESDTDVVDGMLNGASPSPTPAVHPSGDAIPAASDHRAEHAAGPDGAAAAATAAEANADATAAATDSDSDYIPDDSVAWSDSEGGNDSVPPSDRESSSSDSDSKGKRRKKKKNTKKKKNSQKKPPAPSAPAKEKAKSFTAEEKRWAELVHKFSYSEYGIEEAARREVFTAAAEVGAVVANEIDPPEALFTKFKESIGVLHFVHCWQENGKRHLNDMTASSDMRGDGGGTRQGAARAYHVNTSFMRSWVDRCFKSCVPARDYKAYSQTYRAGRFLGKDVVGPFLAQVIIWKCDSRTHRNSNDGHGAWCVTFCGGNFDGGIIYFPDLGLCFRSADLYHCVGPWTPKLMKPTDTITPGRVAFVFFSPEHSMRVLKGDTPAASPVMRHHAFFPSRPRGAPAPHPLRTRSSGDTEARTGLLVSGSQVLQLLDRRDYGTRDIDLYVGNTPAYVVIEWLVYSGYKLTFQTGSTVDENPMLAFNVPNEHFGTDLRDNNSRAYFLAPGSILFKFEKGDLHVDLIVSLGSPLSSILDFHSTAVMNFITAAWIVVLFARATFRERLSLVVRFDGGKRMRDVLSKYELRGFTAVFTTGSSPSFTPRERWIRDDYSPNGDVRKGAARIFKLPQLPHGCASDFWTTRDFKLKLFDCHITRTSMMPWYMMGYSLAVRGGFPCLEYAQVEAGPTRDRHYCVPPAFVDHLPKGTPTSYIG